MKAIPCPVSQEELRVLVWDEKLTDEQIATRLPDGTAKRVRSWRERYGIETHPRWARNEVPPIEGKLHSLLVGSMLGDGRIVHRTNAAHYSESHSGAQRSYLEWKADLWGSWARPIFNVPDNRGYEQVRMNTVAHGALVPWRDMFYPSREKGWKRLVPSIVDLVDEFALAIWYLDDGCSSWWPTITFGMDEGSWKIAGAIFEKFGLQVRWGPKRGATGEFYMEREDTAHRFLDLITPHVPECMSYKLSGFGFQGPHYHVRGSLTEASLRDYAARQVPIQKIARELGVGATTVDTYLKKFGIEHARKRGRPSVMGE